MTAKLANRKSVLASFFYASKIGVSFDFLFNFIKTKRKNKKQRSDL